MSTEKDLVDEAKSELDNLRLVGDDYEPEKILDIVPDAPVADGHIVPVGWSLIDENSGSPCIYRHRRYQDQVIREAVTANPIVLTAWITNETTRQKALEIAWKGRGKWRKAVVDRRRLRDTNKIIDALAGRGFPVHSGNKANLVKYLARYEELNLGHMPVKSVSEQMGWQSDGSFLVGRECLGGSVEFIGADEGEEQMADAVRQRGSLSGWRDAVTCVSRYPKVELALYAGLAPVMLEILGAPNFAVDWAYRTSSGKTSTLKVAASLWGSPDERSARSMIASWDATSVWLERAAAARSHLPLIVDDTKRARKYRGESVVPGVIYEIANGQGRGRGSISGSRATRYWRTVLLTTGETSIVDFSKDAGTVARVLSLWGSPFGGETEQTHCDVLALSSGLLSHFGHAGPAFVSWVMKHQEASADEWRLEFAELAAEFRVKVADDAGKGVASRISSYLAVLEIVGRLAHAALDLPWEYVSPMEACLGSVASESRETDRALEALRYVYDWAVSCQGNFWSRSISSEREPAGGWVGRWDRLDTKQARWENIGIPRRTLSEVLVKGGFDSRSTIRLWGERGWLEMEEKRSTVVAKINGLPSRVIAIKRSAVEAITQSVTNSEPKVTELTPPAVTENRNLFG
jgi:hypothetical protein